MEITLDKKVMDWNDLKFDIRLMALERIIGEFLRRDAFKLSWFRGYQKTDIKRLEETLKQAREQYGTLPEEEKQWVEDLQDFYEDFKSFDWDSYFEVVNDKPKRLEYEMEVGIRWARKLKGLIAGYEPPYEPPPDYEFFNDPLQCLLSQAETEYVRGLSGIWRPKGMVEGDEED